MNKLRNRLILLTLAASLAGILSAPAHVQARAYTVVSCDSASVFGYSSGAWVPFANAGRSYTTCPSGSGLTTGISDRLIGETFSAFQHSGHALDAPAGATITQVRWAGRMARENCRWGTFLRAVPSGASVLGYRNAQLCDATEFDNRSWPISVPTPAGTTRLEQLVICGSPQCPPGATLHTQSVEVTIDDPVPPTIWLTGALASGAWVSAFAGGLQRGEVSASDNAGIAQIQATIGTDTDTQAFACDWSRPQPCPAQATNSISPGLAGLADGRHTLSMLAADAAGNVTTSRQDVYVDNTPPDPVVPEVAGGSDWRRANGFTVSWVTPPGNAAPIVRAHWRLCTSDGACPWRGERAGNGIRTLPSFAAPGPGDFRLHVWLEDAAGNQREANGVASAPLRFDPQPPELAFLAPDPADPLRVAVQATDSHSGVAGGAIEMRASGSNTWHGLRTELQGSQLVAYVDDERFRKGSYQFRARAYDQAGNEASTGTRADGSAASIRLPARIDTRLIVGLAQGRPRRNGPRFDADVLAPFGRTLRLGGLLTNSDGQPIDGATIEVLQEGGDGNDFAVGLATTGARGRFRYVLPAKRNRELVFRYGGSRRIGAATARFRMRVPAASSLAASRARLRNGQRVVFTGRVAGRPLPPAGKLIEVQAHFRGRWRTISTVRSDRRGRWRFPYRFGATLGRVTYRFRAQLPLEGGYPFVTGHSPVTKVVVIGP